MIVEELTIELVWKFKIRHIDLLVGPSHIETKTHQAAGINHLVISNRAIYFGGSEIAAAGHISQDQTTQPKPAGIIFILHHLCIPKNTHGLVWDRHHGRPLVTVIHAQPVIAIRYKTSVGRIGRQWRIHELRKMKILSL